MPRKEDGGIDSICPRCSNRHKAFKEYEYTGKIPAPFFCPQCRNINGQPLNSAMRSRGNTGIKCHGWKIPQGLSKDQNKKRNIDLEIEGRKFRKKYGIRAPSNYFYLSDVLYSERGTSL